MNTSWSLSRSPSTVRDAPHAGHFKLIPRAFSLPRNSRPQFRHVTSTAIEIALPAKPQLIYPAAHRLATIARMILLTCCHGAQQAEEAALAGRVDAPIDGHALKPVAIAFPVHTIIEVAPARVFPYGGEHVVVGFIECVVVVLVE